MFILYHVTTVFILYYVTTVFILYYVTTVFILYHVTTVFILYHVTTVFILYQVGDLAVASPATVSRCGMVFADYIDLGWKPYVESWLQKKQSKVSNILFVDCWSFRDQHFNIFRYIMDF
ncbi:hypothetical protein DPMN_184971 [Dreissena polymorpha]|uniref:Uncharacterized protein n=1 Tax=Dreissena polymorpha TaxID=45954 RepID=A0A9D4DK22_DREPO|nr:hypothetical protein DPMN_184971 [Dreissena polymorpha]